MLSKPASWQAEEPPSVRVPRKNRESLQLTSVSAPQLTCHQVTCKEPGCGAMMPKSELKLHLRRDCLSVKRRDRLALNATNRPAPANLSEEMMAGLTHTPAALPQQPLETKPLQRTVEQVQCEDCGESVVKGRPWVEHKEYGCRMRPTFCPNRAYGCDAVVPLCTVPEHLNKDCEVEKRKEYMIQNSKLRRELVVCTGCGAPLPLCEMKKHEEETCSNRYVPCRNAHLGCAMMVRMRDRAWHEHVDGSAARRSTLYFGPGGNHLFVNEDDMTPPWTVEYWIYRPARIESAKNSIRGVLRRRMHFRLQFLEERSTHHQILILREEMTSLSALSGVVDQDGVRINVFKKEALVGRLADLASKYEDAVVVTERLARYLQISLSAAVAVLEAEVASNATKIVDSLEPEPPGEILSELLKKERMDASERREGESEGEAEIGPDQESAYDPRSERPLDVSQTADEMLGLSKDPAIDETVLNITVFDWLQRIIEVRSNLNNELQTLKKWRDDASLHTQRATPVGSRGVKEASSGVRTKKQLKEERREKERQRREERKRLMRLEAEGMAVSEGEGKEDMPPLQRRETRKKLFERLAEDETTLVGAEVLQSSSASASKICMDVDTGSEARDVEGTGRIGFVTSDGAFAFNASVPRQKWTHVCLVCTAQPKKRVVCYVDGVLAGKVSASFALPMTHIGSPEQDHSFVGCLLDIRVWSIVRSASEIRDTMHKLLHPIVQSRPVSSRKGSLRHTNNSGGTTKSSAADAAEGLVAWWTFEDARSRTGWSSRVSDTSDQRYRVPIVSNSRYDPRFPNFLWLDPTTLRSQVKSVSVATLPVPSFRDRNICIFELKRFKLAQKGRALMKEAPCSNGCGDAVRYLDMRFHCRYECKNRFITCPVPYCNEEYQAKDQWIHEKQECAAVRVRLRFVEQGMHLNELTVCTLCSETMRVRDLKQHEGQECDHRRIACIHADCNEKFPAHMLPVHLQYHCRSDQILRRSFLVRRARQRTNYARPWGIQLSSDNS